MKRLLLCILSTTTLLSCGPDTKPTQQSAAPTINFKTNSVAIPFAGSWISEDYLNKIREHQSPRKAQEGSEECFIQLPDNTLRPATMVINFHEGLSGLVTVSNNGAFQLWDKQGDTLSSPLYTIQTLAADSIKIGDKLFIKINPATTSDDPRILEEILFKGSYNTNKGERVEFKANGEVSGLGKYKYYEPVIDYFDVGLQVDQVGLGETAINLEYFGFKFKKEKLQLYKLNCDAFDDKGKRCVKVSFGEKQYELQKTNEE